MLAPPLVIASISASDHGRLWNRRGSSEMSKNSPSAGFTGPRFLPAVPPIAPYEREVGEEARDPDGLAAGEPFALSDPLPMGPCWVALCL